MSIVTTGMRHGKPPGGGGGSIGGGACFRTRPTCFGSHLLMLLLRTVLSPGCTGNMQQWQVNQRQHLFPSQQEEEELDGHAGNIHLV